MRPEDSSMSVPVGLQDHLSTDTSELEMEPHILGLRTARPRLSRARDLNVGRRQKLTHGITECGRDILTPHGKTACLLHLVCGCRTALEVCKNKWEVENLLENLEMKTQNSQENLGTICKGSCWVGKECHIW